MPKGRRGSSASALGAAEIAQMSLAPRLGPRGFDEGAALAFRNHARHQPLQFSAAAGRAGRSVGGAYQQLDILVAFRTMVAIQRHGRASRRALERGGAGTGPS